MPDPGHQDPPATRELDPVDSALRESEERFRSVFRESRVGMLIVSLEGRFLAVNRAFCEFLGYSETELLQKDVASVTYSEDLPYTIELLSGVIAKGEQFPSHEKRYLRKDGTTRWGEVAASIVRSAEGQPKYFVTQVLDIRGRKEAEEARLRLASIVESSDDAIIRKNIDGIITDWNKGAEQLYGYSAHDIIGKSISLLVPPDCADDFPMIMSKLRLGQTVKNYETLR